MKVKRVLIVIPRWFVGDTVNYRYMFPLGLAYISSVLKQAGYAVDCLNLNHYEGPIGPIVAAQLARHSYDLACTGGISTFYNQIRAAMEAVRAADPAVRIVLGGGIISSEPELIYDDLRPDYGILGEGEAVILDLLQRLERGEEPPRLISAAEPIADIDQLPYPDFEGFGFAAYLDHMHPTDQFAYDLFDKPRSYPVIGSRSCPFQCTFCFHPLGTKYRQRSLDSLMAELETNVRRYHINIISIYDELFSNDRARVMEFCRRMTALRATLGWDCRWGCQMRVDKLDDGMLAAMKAAGCYLISYGFESYHPDVLKSMKKQIAPEQIDRAVELTMKNRISIQGNFIFGDTAETPATAAATLAYWEKHVDAGIILSFINPYPGTAIYRRLVERGVIKDKIDFIANHIFDIFNMSEKMNDNDFGRLWFNVFKAGLSNRLYAGKYQLSEAGDGTVSIRLACPHCGARLEYKNYYVMSKYFLLVMFYCRECRRRFFLASRLYRVIASLLLTVSALMPGVAYSVFSKAWTFLRKHDPRFRKGLLTRRLSDR